MLSAVPRWDRSVGVRGSGRECLGLGWEPQFPSALLRACLWCIFSSGDCPARYYFHMFLQEIIEGEMYEQPLVRNASRIP